jgi:hypothetical protein
MQIPRPAGTPFLKGRINVGAIPGRGYVFFERSASLGFVSGGNHAKPDGISNKKYILIFKKC